MRILLLVQYFALPGDPGGSRAYQFARRWAARGQEVTVLAGNVNYKTGRSVPCLPGRSWSVEDHPDGFRLYRLWSYSRFRGSFRKRLLFFGSYAANASVVGSFLRPPDLVCASTTPLTVGVPGWLLSRRYRVPFVFEVRDLWPEAAVAAGVMKSPAMIRRTAALSRYLYSHADHLLALTRGIAEGIASYGIPPERIALIPNGVDDWMDPERFRSARPIGAEGRFLCLYVGAHGLWNNLETLLSAAEELRKDPQILFVFIGDGDRRRALEEEARRKGLDNVRFLGARSKEEAFAAMVQADLGLIAASDHPHNRQTLPNKIFDYMAAGIPVQIAAGDGEMAELLRASGGGWTSPPEDGPALARAILEARAAGEKVRRAVGAAGRAHALRHYSRTRLADEVLGIFEGLQTRAAASPAGQKEMERTRGPSERAGRAKEGTGA